MTNLKDLEKYIDYEFSSGVYTGDDYIKFQNIYISYLKSIAKENGWELAKVNKNHYEFSAFFKFKYKYIYFSISDVRFFNNDWFYNILVRKAKHIEDYSGERNEYTSLPSLQLHLNAMFNR